MKTVFDKLGGYLGAYSICPTCTVKIPAGTGYLYKQVVLGGLEQTKECAVSDAWIGSWVFLLPPLKVNIQSSFFKAQYRDFTVASLGRVAVISVSG